MKTLTRHLCLGLLILMAPAARVVDGQTQKVTITKCQNCSNKAGVALKSCMTSGGSASCQAAYQKKMKHCNKKFCNAKTTKAPLAH